MNFCRVKEFISRIPYNIKNGIINLILWFPVIWQDRQWDSYFIYKVLRHKLYLTEKHIRLHGHHVDHLRDAKNIKTCILLLDRLINDVHFDMAWKQYDKKWGERRLLFLPPDKEGFRKIDIKHENVKEEQDKKDELRDFKRWSAHEDMLKKQDIDLLFKIMSKQIQSWWD